MWFLIGDQEQPHYDTVTSNACIRLREPLIIIDYVQQSSCYFIMYERDIIVHTNAIQ